MATNSDRLIAEVLRAAPGATVVIGNVTDLATVVITFPPGATPEQQADAQAVVDSFDPSPDVHAAWELSQNRTKALTTALTRADDTAITVRAWLVATTKLINDRLEALGQTRVLEPEILSYIRANPTLGDPSDPTV